MSTIERPVLDEIAGAERDFSLFGDYLGKVVLNPDRLLRSEGRGIGLYEDLARDPQVRACLQSRRLAVIGKEWEVVPGGEDQQDLEIAAFIKDAFLAFDFDSSRYALLGGILTGFKVCEVLWEYSEGSVWVKDMPGRSAGRFVFGTDGSLRLLTPKEMAFGEPVPDKKFQIFRYGGENGSLYGDGLGASLYWPCWFKKNAIKFWMIFAEKFGSPTVIGKYPPGTPKEHQDALLSALEAIQQETAIKIPETMRVELLEAQRTGTVNTYEALCSFMNEEISKTILGQTLTTQVGDTGSYAASKVHDGVRQDYVKADADLLSNALNKGLIRWLVDFNYPGVKRYPKVWIKFDEQENLESRVRIDEALLRMGVRIPKKYFYSTYGIPEPMKDEPITGQV